MSALDACGNRVSLALPAGTTRPAADRAPALGVSAPALLLAAFGLTLGRLTGAMSLVVDVSAAGVAGPVRIDIDDDAGPRDFIHGVQESLARSLDGEPPGWVRFEVRHWPGPGFEAGSDPGPEAGATGAARPAVAVQLQDAGVPGAGYVEYATGLWATGEAQGFACDYAAAVAELAAAADGADAALADVRCISVTSRRALDAINDTSRAFPRSSVDELFRAAARRWPGALAVRDAQAALTYAELAAAAAEQAHVLRAAGVREGDTVLVCVPRSVAEAVAVLGTLWAGAAYVGVDLAQPESHTARIIAKAAPAAAIAADGEATRLAAHAVPAVAAWHQEWAPSGQGVPAVPPDPDRLAYIAFTSGSTGEPKGVAIAHRAVIRLVHDPGYLIAGPGERLLRMASLAFDASTVEIWGALATGAILEVCPPDALSPAEIGSFIAERQITVAWITAGFFRLIQEFAGESLGSVRQLLTGGDVVPHEHVKRALEKNPGLVITNGYGPTENTTFTTVHSVRDPADVDGPLPIGKPVPGTRVYVLDKRGRLLMPGAVGELYAAGEGLAAGYYNDPAETGRSFGFLSPDVGERLYRTGDLVRIDGAGRLRFLGRADDQVKIRGFRIELPAISASLNAQAGVAESVVTVTEGDSTEKKIIAAVRLAPGAAVTPADLRDRLGAGLPSYMVPHLWAVVDQLPVTANGKVDRRRLAALARPASAFVRQA